MGRTWQHLGDPTAKRYYDPLWDRAVAQLAPAERAAYLREARGQGWGDAAKVVVGAMALGGVVIVALGAAGRQLVKHWRGHAPAREEGE